METHQPVGVTLLLERWSNGDERALAELMPLVQDELHRQAANYMRRERPDHTLQPTALVNEAYLKLVNQRQGRWQNRAQFFGVAAQLMRRILVDHARAHRAGKRGGSQIRLSLTHADYAADQPATDLLAVHEALERLAVLDERQSRIVELKFFGGLTIAEITEVTGISHASVEREWNLARAWLRRELG